MRRTLVIAIALLACNEDAGEDQNSKTGSRLQILSYEMADGSRLVRGFWDTATQEDCVVSPHADGKLRCLPSLAYKLGPAFRSDQCAGDLVAIAPKELAPHSKFGIDSDGFRTRVFKIGETVGFVYEGTQGACTKVEVTDKRIAYTASIEAPGTDFVEAFEQRNP